MCTTMYSDSNSNEAGQSLKLESFKRQKNKGTTYLAITLMASPITMGARANTKLCSDLTEQQLGHTAN